MKLWLVSDRQEDAKYEVLEYANGTAKLRGKYATILQKLDVQSLKQAGYRLIKEHKNAIKP